MLDDFAVQWAMLTGYAPGHEPPPAPVCPECGNVCDRFYKTRRGQILGCEWCVSEVDAWDDC